MLQTQKTPDALEMQASSYSNKADIARLLRQISGISGAILLTGARIFVFVYAGMHPIKTMDCI